MTTTSDLTINGGLGTEILTFAPGAGSSIGGNVLINGPLTGNATLNVTDPVAAAVTGTFTIDFGAGHTGLETLNIIAQAGDTITGVPVTGTFNITFPPGTGKTPWTIKNFVLGQDPIPTLFV